jgi:hypothetical protein
VKAAFLALVLLLALYPRLDRFAAWLVRLRDMNSVIDPHHPALSELEQEVRRALPAGADGAAALPLVQEVVLERIPYAWDWDTWGVMDYLPTVEETFRAGREDCDGRAVVAASLLRRMGYEAWLACDVLHVWVATPDGQTMGPTSSSPTLTSGRGPGETGTRLTLTPALASQVVRGLGYGVAVFPVWRELAIAAAICLAGLQPRSSIARRGAGCGLVFTALLGLRSYGDDAAMSGASRHTLAIAAAFLVFAIGVGLLVWRSRRPAELDRSGAQDRPPQRGRMPR